MEPWTPVAAQELRVIYVHLSGERAVNRYSQVAGRDFEVDSKVDSSSNPWGGLRVE